MSWKFVTGSDFLPDSGSETPKFRMSGTDFLRHQWTAVEGQYADVKDPHLHQDFKFQIYTVATRGVITRFAAGEFVNGYWGFYMEAPPSK